MHSKVRNSKAGFSPGSVWQPVFLAARAPVTSVKLWAPPKNDFLSPGVSGGETYLFHSLRSSTASQQILMSTWEHDAGGSALSLRAIQTWGRDGITAACQECKHPRGQRPYFKVRHKATPVFVLHLQPCLSIQVISRFCGSETVWTRRASSNAVDQASSPKHWL